MNEIEEEKSMSRQIEKQKKYKEIYGDLDENQYEDADVKQKEHKHETIKNHNFINQMILEQTLSSEGKGLSSLKDENIFKLLQKIGYLYGKIISRSEFEEKPLLPIFTGPLKGDD